MALPFCTLMAVKISTLAHRSKYGRRIVATSSARLRDTWGNPPGYPKEADVALQVVQTRHIGNNHNSERGAYRLRHHTTDAAFGQPRERYADS